MPMSAYSDQIGSPFDEPIPDVAEPIVGYRYWSWNDTGLTSQRGTEWKLGEVLKATCKPVRTRVPWGGWGDDEPATCVGSPSAPFVYDPTVPAPAPKKHDTWEFISYTQRADLDPVHGEYGCGIYCYMTVEDMWRELGYSINQSNVVIGEVEIWGLVWPHEKGYRAEFARPKAFYRPTAEDRTTPFWGDPIEVLAAQWGVELKDVPLSVEERERIEKERADEASTRMMKSIISMSNQIQMLYGPITNSNSGNWTFTTHHQAVQYQKPALGLRSFLGGSSPTMQAFDDLEDEMRTRKKRHGFSADCPIHGPTKGGTCHKCARRSNKGKI